MKFELLTEAGQEVQRYRLDRYTDRRCRGEKFMSDDRKTQHTRFRAWRGGSATAAAGR